MTRRAATLLLALLLSLPAAAQSPPTAAEVEGYRDLLAATAGGDVRAMQRLLDTGDGWHGERDRQGRTPLIVAGHRRDLAAAGLLIAAGADVNALDHDRYDLLTIAAVNDDRDLLRLALKAGADAGQVTSPYDGTALIAAAHLGHVEVVRALITAGAPLDHVNNLGWTALIEAVVLGDGGPRHTAIVRDLLAAGADPDIPDRGGKTARALAEDRGFDAMIEAFDRERR